MLNKPKYGMRGICNGSNILSIPWCVCVCVGLCLVGGGKPPLIWRVDEGICPMFLEQKEYYEKFEHNYQRPGHNNYCIALNYFCCYWSLRSCATFSCGENYELLKLSDQLMFLHAHMMHHHHCLILNLMLNAQIR